MTGESEPYQAAARPKMRVIAFGAVLGAALVAALATDALAKCDKPPMPWKFGGNLTTTWRSTEGSVCTTTSNHPQNIEKIKIISKPQHGVAGRDGPFGVAYKPDAGYRGSDTFVYLVTSNSNFRKGAGWVAKITVLVKVE